MRIKLLLICVFLLSYFLNSFANEEVEKNIIKAINLVDFDKAVLDVCNFNYKYCEILTDEKVYYNLKGNYRLILYVISKVESNFKYKDGIYDKDDISYYQINKRIWNKELLKKLNVGYPYNVIKHDYYKSTEVALRIWLVNFSHRVLITKKLPKILPEFIHPYHKVNSVDVSYLEKVKSELTDLNLKRRVGL